ncbi:MAG: hypothetical protein HQK77_17005, partial [Desulfobacterales bacterium]|nr:hypothetical protein [Desulfobacterales bacterium]
MLFYELNRYIHIIIGIVAICLLIPNLVFSDKQADFGEDTSDIDALVQFMKNEMELITIATKSKQQKISQAPS